MTDGYETDFHRWAETQAGLLRARSALDWDNLGEEIEASPTVASYPATRLARASVRGREDAEAGTSLLHLPEGRPWPVEQAVDCDFLPGLPWEADEP
jgi:hypothetical protein